MQKTLKIYESEQDIVAAVKSNRRLVLQAPTGSGKSTQVPQILLKHGFLEKGQVVTLQPRRLAARLLASRVARELGVPLGREVGYQVRFENVASAATRIKFETEGILLRQLVHDPALRGIQAVIFDEFHERHLYGDITLARALDIQEQSRPDLLIIVMSATLEAASLERYLSPCVVLRSEGRTFPVTVDYLAYRSGPNPPLVWDLAADAFSKHAPRVEGDVLVFMPGGYEINRTIEAIRRRPESKGYILLPLHGELPPRDQDAAVANYDQPKVVVATNVAETSITIEGVRLVIDSGLARVPRYDPNRGINTLLIEKISRASADQRTGRAGRVAAGHSVRLWSQAEHKERPAHELPEVKRLDLSEVVLTLKASGVQDLRSFRWLESPSEAALAHAEELLVDLGALHPLPPVGALYERPGGRRPPLQEGEGGRKPGEGIATSITPLGQRMLAFPIHPRYSRMLLAAEEYNCVYQACLIAALTQTRDTILRSALRDDSSRETASSDFWLLMRNVKTHELHEQFLRIAKEQGLDTRRRDIDEVALRKCILIGFSDRVARRLDEGTLRCELVRGRRGTLARESVVKESPLFVASEVREIGGRAGDVNTILSLATAIEVEWLRELFPADLHSGQRVSFDSSTRRVLAEDVLQFRDLVVTSRLVEPPPADAAARLLAEEVVAGRVPLPNWDHAIEQWILRLNLLAQWCPDLQLPPIRDEDRRHIIEQICLGAVSYKDLKDREVKPVVKSWLSALQRELLDKHAPERVTLSNGRSPKVTYVTDGPPYISLRIQELFGVTQTPTIAMGRVPLSVHILAPSMRPVQVTQDLGNFWREHYPRVKPELQRKYPKHEWR